MKLELPKKKLYIARALRYVGLAATLIACFVVWIMQPAAISASITVVVLILLFMAMMLAGQYWIINLYKCPKCETKILPWRGGRYSNMEKVGLENNCPEYCPKCGLKIVVEITEE